MFQQKGIKFDLVLKQFNQTEHLILSEIYWIKEITAVYWLHQKKFNTGSNWTFCEPILSKLSLMIDTTERCIVFLVFFTLIQGHGDARREESSETSYLPKLSMDLEEIWHTVETCSSYESRTHFILFSQYSKERIQLSWFHQKTLRLALQLDIYQPISFKLRMMIDTTKLYSSS